LPIGTLRDAVFYPAPASRDVEEIRRVLTAVRLAHLIERLDDVDQWGQRLSGGEQQRLGFARLLFSRPQTIFLDEATSALDEETESHLYAMLRQSEWKPTIVSIGHRATLAAHHDRILELTQVA
jgi:vitamin B12/bleomycin/antimicrobial peptide transport system ATP-binding/permease protein